MDILEFDISKPFNYNWSGKFEAPDDNWIHMTRELGDFEFIVMTSGTLYIASEKEKYEVHTGEYLLMEPTSHQYGYKASNCSFYWAHFSYNDLNNDPVHYKDSPKPLSADSKKILIPCKGQIPSEDRIIILLKQLQNCDIKYRNINLNNYSITIVFCELYSQLYLSNRQAVKKDGKLQLYTDIVDYINWRIREHLQVSDVAAYFGYNEKYITTFFKKISGMSLKSYIIEKKMELAKALLTDTNSPIAQIGYEIGFSDNHNFSNAFKKVTGQSPSEYRNTYAERSLYHQ